MALGMDPSLRRASAADTFGYRRVCGLKSSKSKSNVATDAVEPSSTMVSVPIESGCEDEARFNAGRGVMVDFRTAASPSAEGRRPIADDGGEPCESGRRDVVVVVDAERIIMSSTAATSTSSRNDTRDLRGRTPRHDCDVAAVVLGGALLRLLLLLPLGNGGKGGSGGNASTPSGPKPGDGDDDGAAAAADDMSAS